MKIIISILIIINLLQATENKIENNLTKEERKENNKKTTLLKNWMEGPWKHTYFRNSNETPFKKLTETEQALDLLKRIRLQKRIDSKKIYFVGKSIDKYITSVKENDKTKIKEVLEITNDQNISSWIKLINEIKKSKENNETNNYKLDGSEFKITPKGKLTIKEVQLKNSIETKYKKLTEQEQALDLLLRIKLRKIIKPKQMTFMGTDIEELILNIKKENKKTISKILHNTNNKNVKTWDELINQINSSKNRVKIYKKLGIPVEPKKIEIDTSSGITKALKYIYKAL